MPGLPATGELSYNGYEFDGATHIETAVEFLYDDAGRTIIAHRHTITVDAIVADDSDLDGEVLNIRKRLGEAGKKLTFISKGFGDDLRAIGNVSDVAAGPHPQELFWKPLGDDKTAEIRWQVVVTVPLCVVGSPAFVGVMALNYSIAYKIDAMTDTTRTIAGYIQIAQKAGTGVSASDTADRFRRNFAPNPIAGFKRESTWTGNLKKSRVDFAIVDTQIPSQNPYPPNVMAIDGRHRLSWRRGREGARMRNTISMTITPEAGLTGSQAWAVFLTIAAQRIAKAKANAQPVLIESLEVEENLFGRPQSFSVSYTMLSCIQDFVGDAGLWEPLGTNWNSWRVSLRTTMFDNDHRGNADLQDLAVNDVVVNLCKSPGIAFVSPNSRRKFAEDNRIRSGGLRNEVPPADKSFLSWDSRIMSFRNRPAVRQSIIQAPTKDEDSWELNSGTMKTRFGFGSSGGVTPDVIQEGGAGRHGVRIVGRATRVGHQIARPAIVTIGDKPAVERWFRGMQWVVGNFFGVPVYGAQWAADYLIASSPGTIKPPNEEKEWVDAQLEKAAEPSPGTIP